LLKLDTMITLGNLYHEWVHVVYDEDACPIVDVADEKGRKRKIEDSRGHAWPWIDHFFGHPSPDSRFVI